MDPVGAPAREPGLPAASRPGGAPAEPSPNEHCTEPRTQRCEAAAIRENLARLRLDREWTQRRLAGRAGLSRAAVGRIERGLVTPRTETLEALASALGVGLGDLVLPVRPLRSVRFRALAPGLGREQILAEASKWLDGYRLLEERLGDSPEFGFRSARRRNPAESPRAVAGAARNAVDLSPDAPVPDLCRLLEDHGVKVLPLRTQRDSFSGLSVGPEDGGPAVVVNTGERIPVERRIFTAARELGHLLLHSDEYDRAAAIPPEADTRKSEQAADAFAGEFLMPETAFGPAWDATRGDPFPSRVLKVGRLFRVSYRTVLDRLIVTGRATREAWDTFRAGHEERYGRAPDETGETFPLTESEARTSRRADEPDGLSVNGFGGNRLFRLVRRGIEEEVITLGRAAEILGLRRVALRGWMRGWSGESDRGARRRRFRRRGAAARATLLVSSGMAFRGQWARVRS